MSKTRDLADLLSSGDLNFTGGLNVDSGTLFVDEANNRVGMGTSSPTTKLDVTGEFSFRGNHHAITGDHSAIVPTDVGSFYPGVFGNPSSSLHFTALTNSASLRAGFYNDNNFREYHTTNNQGAAEVLASGASGEVRIFTSPTTSGTKDQEITDLRKRATFESNGDISFYEDTGTTPKFFWDASAERLGIGTDSPEKTLDVNADAEINGLTVGRGGGNDFRNTAVGLDALKSNTSGDNNTAVGRRSLRDNTTGERNTSFGVNTLMLNTTGSNNVAVGLSTLIENTEGDDNVAVGYEALQLNTTGLRNNAVGIRALENNTSGIQNTATGGQALRDNTTGDSNIAIGHLALAQNTIGRTNVAMGVTALRRNTQGDDNVAYGYAALLLNTTGTNNIGIGYNAGRSDSPFSVTTQNNRIVMGNNNHTDAYIKVSWTVTSDSRDKTEFAPVPHGLDFINALEPTEYQFKVGGRESEQGDGRRRYGFLAQDVMALEGDNVVIADAEDPENLKLKESQIIPVLVNAVKELAVQVEDLKTEINQLKEK